MKIYLKLEAPFEWVRINAKQVEAFGEVPSVADYPIGDDDDVIGVVSGEWVTTHKVNLPAKTRKQFKTALPYALEESISEDVENMHFIFPNWKVGEECHVSVVSKEKMLEWQTLSTENRLPVEHLVTDYSLVPINEAADYTLALYGDKLLSNQRDGYGVSIDRDFLDVCLMEVPVNSAIAVNDESLTAQLISEYPNRDFKYWQFGSKLSHFLEYKPQFLLDLWGDVYKPKVSRKGSKAFLLPVIVIFVALLIKMSYDAYRYVSLHAEISAIQTESKVLLTDSFPLLNSVVPGAEREMMERAISKMGGPDRSKSMHTALADAAAILGRQNISLINIVYRNSELILTCKLSNFSQVDTLTKQFNQTSSLLASLQSSASEDGNVIASYSLRHK